MRFLIANIVLFVALLTGASAAYLTYEDVPDWGQPTVARAISVGAIQGTGETAQGVKTLELSHDFLRTLVVMDRQGDFGTEEVVLGEPWILVEDRNSPIYEVYKNGAPIHARTDIQWMIRDLCAEYGFEEELVFGMIVAESGFSPGSTSPLGHKGLAQISTFWITEANIEHFTSDYRSRNLYDPYDNLLTLMEMWTYARDSYGIDLTTDTGRIQLLRWHNSGRYVESGNWPYADKILNYMDELVRLQ